MSYTISTTSLSHEGGTKYYQVFLFSAVLNPGAKEPMSAALTLTHYGPYRGRSHMDMPLRPVEGGQVQIIPGDTYLGKIHEKMKRGYSPVRLVRTEEVKSFSTIQEFETELLRLLGKSNTEQVMLNLVGYSSAAEMTLEDIEGGAHPSHGGETTSIEERPAGWGTWS